MWSNTLYEINERRELDIFSFQNLFDDEGFKNKEVILHPESKLIIRVKPSGK